MIQPRIFLLAFVGAVLALGYVQLQIAIVSLGYELETLRYQKTELLDQHRILQYNVLTLRSPVILSSRLKARDVQLKPPKQVERIRGAGHPFTLSPSFRPTKPTAYFPAFFQRATSTIARWFQVGRQAEAEPAP